MYRVKWFHDGTTNASYNSLDRHLERQGDQVAIIWEPDDPNTGSRKVTYAQLHESVSRFANALKSQGVRQGDVVVIYMPMIIEATVAMLACSRIGAIHSVVFAGFSPEALAGRIIDSSAKIIVTADEGRRGGKTIPLKASVDEALTHPEIRSVEKVIVFRHSQGDIPWHPHRDVCWQELTRLASPHCEPRQLNAEDPLFILYTSGSTGQPKGIVHTTGGYLVYAAMTFAHVFDYRDQEVFRCQADVGWITGHTYLVYGPLLNGATLLMHEGLPGYPDSNRTSTLIDAHKVNILYTAPTIIRSLMAEGDKAVANSHRRSLRLLGSVGEPINPEAWHWYYTTIGEQRCPIMDTWWQTETGGIMITPPCRVLPSSSPAQPADHFLGYSRHWWTIWVV